MERIFQPWPKIARLNREIVVTEKIDGTNAAVCISDDGTEIWAQSRTQIITPGKKTDNHGFAAWVEFHRAELLRLGPGHHFGEWWGKGIQRGYGLDEKRFWLFNTHRWSNPETRPACVGCVPILYKGPFDQSWINGRLDILRSSGSVAAPGFMKPEGIVVYHTAANTMFKVTCEKDDEWKGLSAQ